MDQDSIKLLKFALSLGGRAIRSYGDISYHVGVDDENEYYTMICELAEKLGVNPSDIADY